MNQTVSCNNPGNDLFCLSNCVTARRNIPGTLNCSSLRNEGITACAASCSQPASVLHSVASSISYTAISTASRSTDRSQQTPVIVSANCGQAEPHVETSTPYGTAPYANHHNYGNNETLTQAPVLQAPSFLQPYYGLSPTLSNFNVLQMCCYQPFFQEVRVFDCVINKFDRFVLNVDGKCIRIEPYFIASIFSYSIRHVPCKTSYVRTRTVRANV